MYPPRVFDGYGLTKKSIDNVLKEQPTTQVIITTDNGSNAADGIAYAKEKGLVVLVTDHHQSQQSTMRDAEVNPNRSYTDETYPFKGVSGTTVIYKTLLAYGQRYCNDPDAMIHFKNLLLLVGISTVSDVMPLLDENRYFVKESLDMLNHLVVNHDADRSGYFDDSPVGQYYRGLSLLLTTLDKNDRLKYALDSDSFGFLIGPIFNSPRRMLGESRLGFDLFQTKQNTFFNAVEGLISDRMYALNEERKAYTKAYTEALYEKITDAGYLTEKPLPYCVFNSVVKSGISGLLAGKFTETYGLPSVSFAVPDLMNVTQGLPLVDLINVSTNGDFMMSGSARAPEGFDLYQFLASIDADHPGMITSWGGHPQAAGITIHASQFDAFRDVFVSRLTAVLASQSDDADVSDECLPVVSEYVITTPLYDHWVCRYPLPNGVTPVVVNHKSPIMYDQTLGAAVSFFEGLHPFGNAFAKPVFSVMFSISDVEVFIMGSDKQHAKLTLPNGLAIICWNKADLFSDVISERIFVVSGELSVNEFCNRQTLQLISNDVNVY